MILSKISAQTLDVVTDLSLLSFVHGSFQSGQCSSTLGTEVIIIEDISLRVSNLTT